MVGCFRFGCALLFLAVLVGPQNTRAQEMGRGDTLRLGETVERVLGDNIQAEVARRELEIAENNHSLGNAGFWPQLTGQAEYTETRSTSEQTFLSGETQNTENALSTQSGTRAELRWTVFDGLRPFATYDRLGAERDRQDAATTERLEVLVSDVIEGYYDVARRQQQLTVFREAVSISRERLRIAELRRELGSGSDLEVRQARIDLNADSSQLLQQAVDVANAKNRLNQLQGRPDEASTQYAVVASIEIDTSLTHASLKERAFQESPALAQAREARAAAQAERREVRADFFPTVDLSLGYGYSQLDAESGFLQQNVSTDFSYGISLTFDFFDGFNRWRRQQNAEIRITNAQLAVRDVELQLGMQLRNAYDRYRNRLELVELERQNLESARENVEIALERFEVGTITSVELREVQEQFVEAESRVLSAEFEAKQAEIELLRLSGQLLPGVREEFGVEVGQ